MTKITAKIDGKDVIITLNREQIEELHKSLSKKYTLKDLQSYLDACDILGEKADTCASKTKQLFTIIKAANFIDNDHKIWDVEEAFDNHNKSKYIGWFEKLKSGWSFYVSIDCYSYSYGPVALYYKESSTCTTICKRFESLYVEYLREGL